MYAMESSANLFILCYILVYKLELTNTHIHTLHPYIYIRISYLYINYMYFSGLISKTLLSLIFGCLINHMT